MKEIKFALLLTVMVCNTLLFSQKRKEKFNQVSREEIQMTMYEKDTLAEAIVLFDIGKTMFYETDRGGYDIRFTRHKRIKILDKNKAAQFAKIEIPYYQDGYGKTEIIKSIKATTFTINTENQLIETKLERSEIYDEQINERWHQKKFTFPDVQDGSVLDFIYELETPFHFNLPDWTFQDKIPTVYSEYEVRMIPFYEYVFYAKGISKFNYQNSVASSYERNYRHVNFKDYIHTYVLKDIPAFRDESYITSSSDYIKKMDFQLAKFHDLYGNTEEIISTWPKLNESLLDHKKFGKYLKKSSKYAKTIFEEELNILGINEKQKAEKIITYVKNKFAWNGRNSKYASQSAKEFYTKKEGNSADINLFLMALLTEAAIDNKPILLSTRDHGKIPVSHPFNHLTNYTAVFVNTETPFLTDATEKMLPYNMLPIKCFNEKALVVTKEKQAQWLDLRSHMTSIEIKNIELKLDVENQEIYATTLIQGFDYKGFIKRKKFRDDSLKIKEHYVSNISNIYNVKTRNYTKYTKPYYIRLEGGYEPEKIGNNYMIYPLLNFPLTKNPLIQKERNYPVDFEFKKEEHFVCTFTIPENCYFSSIPDSFNLQDDLVEIKIDYLKENDQLKINGRYKFKRSVYEPHEYNLIKQHLSSIVKYFNQPVLVKNNSKY